MNNKLIKKASIFTVSLFTIVSLMAFSPGNKSYAASNTDSTNQIKSVITNYFNSEFESIKKGQAVNEDSIISNGKLKEFIILRNNREGLWYKKLNYKLINYSINLNYNSIIFNGDICTIDLSKDNQFSFDQDPNIVSKESGEKHVLTLKKTDNKWLIDDDVDVNKFEDNNSNNSSDNSINNLIKDSAVSDTALDKDIANLREKTNTIDTEINEYKKFKENVNQARKNKVVTNSLLANNSLLSTSSTSKTFEGRTWQVDYNYKAAVAYADMWANSYNNYNYSTLSNDCANFVSQSIYAGAPVMNTGTVGWFGGKTINGAAWVLVKNQWNFLVTNTGKGPVAIDNTNRYDICDGDPIQLWSVYANDYNHSMIVTAIGETGDLYVNGHTSARKEYPLVSAYATGNYNQSKQRTAHILGYNN